MKFKPWSLAAIAFLSGGVTATPVRTYHNGTLGLGERATPIVVTSSMLTNMEFYVQYAAAAYCNAKSDLVGDAVTCSSSACPLVEAASATNYAYLGMDDSEVTGLVAIDPTNKLIVVTYRGTVDYAEFIADLLVPFSDCEDLVPGCKMHQGFQYAWEDVDTQTMSAVKAAVAAYPTYSVLTTGHSLGGAVATIAAAYLRNAGIAANLYTYGSPRVGNDDFVNYVGSQDGENIRVTHTDDPIPRYPANLFGYRHTSPEFWLSTGHDTTTSYALGDIEVCTGIKNTHCNAGESSIDLTAHSYYFQKVSACK